MEIQLWREILAPYRQAVEELVVKFNHIIEEYHTAEMYCPIEQVNGRVKKISSILEKCQRKGVRLEDLEDRIEDIAGIRVICQFVEDIEKVVEIIQKRSDMEIKKEKDYITNSKASGYRSYHVIVYYTVQTINGPKKLEVEIQIRTLAMNFWATIEHSLQYKYQEHMPDEVRERLLRAAKAVDALDMEMASVRGEIMDAQNSNRHRADIVGDILNNIENLYRAMNKREVTKIQDEFFRVYQENDISLLERFNKQLDILSESYRAQSLM
jgi:putative GTP pyrophosphokinase